MNKDLITSRIKDHLLLRGITLVSLADKIGASRQYVSNILNDHGKSISLNVIIKIANVLGIEVGELLLPPPTLDSTQSDNQFSAVVKCRRGIFKATSLRELRNITDILSGNSNIDAMALMKKTLERMLRFPDGKYWAIISELMANLFRSMYTDEWICYYKNKLTDLLPISFQIDYEHLSTFMSKEEIEDFRKTIF